MMPRIKIRSLMAVVMAFIFLGVTSKAWVWSYQTYVEYLPSRQPVSVSSKHSLTQLIRITRDQPILEALYYLQSSSAASTVDVLLTQQGRVFFKDMRQMGKHLRHFDALSWRSDAGEWVIFIHQKHRIAPPQALAALISHEAMHSDIDNSLCEEVAGWHQEARLWIEMQQNYPVSSVVLADKQQQLVHRLERLRQAELSNELEQLVRSNKGYTGLPETSPGFRSQVSYQGKPSH